MPNQARQQPYADTLVGQRGDERASPAVAAAPIHPRPLVQVVKVLGHGVGAKALAWICHSGEQGLRVRVPIAAVDINGQLPLQPRIQINHARMAVLDPAGC